MSSPWILLLQESKGHPPIQLRDFEICAQQSNPLPKNQKESSFMQKTKERRLAFSSLARKKGSRIVFMKATLLLKFTYTCKRPCEECCYFLHVQHPTLNLHYCFLDFYHWFLLLFFFKLFVTDFFVTFLIIIVVIWHSKQCYSYW